jgi:predicted transcriptional regulator
MRILFSSMKPEETTHQCAGSLLERGRASISELGSALDENRRTLQRDLKLLIAEGFIREIGTGPTDPTLSPAPVRQAP